MRTITTLSVAALAAALVAGRAPSQDWKKLLETAKAPLAEAITKALAEAKEGVATGAEIEDEGGKIRYSVDVAQGAKKTEFVFDAADWKLLEKDTEDEDQSKIVSSAKLTLAQTIEAALKKAPGQAVLAELEMDGEKPRTKVKVFAGGKVTVVVVDAVSGEIVSAEAAKAQEADQDEKPFTNTFGEDEKDFVTTGSNPFFILEPGWVIEMENADKKLVIVQTVLDETKKIAGVECRAVEVRETVGGVLKEVTRDYFVISKRTNNVYYFGEDVDVYKDGKVVNHEGAWLAGEKGARYGLFMAATPLLGARYYQEIAPGVAMDRGEVASLTDKFECPAGKFENVLRITETSEIEKDENEANYYARGIGPIGDDDAKLVKYGKAKKWTPIAGMRVLVDRRRREPSAAASARSLGRGIRRRSGRRRGVRPRPREDRRVRRDRARPDDPEDLGNRSPADAARRAPQDPRS